MPSIFSRLKGRDNTAKVKEKKIQGNSRTVPQKKEWEDAWARKSVEPEEVYELLHRSIPELKLRGLDIPFLLLPYRPISNSSTARSFIRSYFENRLDGENLAHELRLVEPMVLCSVIKWCWSRIAGGVVGWDAYQLFRVGESDSNMARSSFSTFIPLSVDSDARCKIIFDFFDLLSAVAANSKFNGLGGRKLSRLAGWWAFEQSDDGNGFEGGYRKWTAAADATCHLFFAYLRSLSPELGKGLSCISRLPVSLQKLVQETEYPPNPLKNIQTQTSMVLMVVDRISPTPLSLLRRASHFKYRDDDKALMELADYSDPEEALTTECRRVLGLIASGNQTHILSPKDPTDPTQVSWSRFEDLGFSGSIYEKLDGDDLNSVKHNVHDLSDVRDFSEKNFISGRPTTPSWGQFLSSGFVNVETISPLPLKLPNNISLPPIEVRSNSSRSFRPTEDESLLQPGELASISKIYLDDAFWWVWISSLAMEEYAERKAVFGRCALIETVIPSGKWILMEEKVKGAQSTPQEGAYIAEKKHFWSRTKKIKPPNRRKSVGLHVNETSNSERSRSPIFPRADTFPDTHARIQAAAARLQRIHQEESADKYNGSIKSDCSISMNINNLTLIQPNIVSEASPAMTWAKNYDKITSREKNTLDSNLTPVSNPPPEDQQPSSRDLVRTPVDEKPFSSQVNVNDTPSKESVYYMTTNEDAEKEDSTQDSATKPANNTNIAKERSNELERQTTKDSIRTRSRKDSASAGLKKIFSMNKPQNLRDADHPPQTSVGREAMERMMKDNVLVRKLSGRKGKPPSSAGKISPIPNYSPEEQIPTYGIRKDSLVSPQVTDLIAVPSVENVSRISTREENKAKQEFSRFDQGPLEDFPSCSPDGLDDDETDEGPKSSPNAHLKTPISDENWALLRQKALEKLADRKTSEKTHSGSKLSKDKNEAEDDEETIEARVARIKARVAQLTGQSEVGARAAQLTHRSEAGTHAAQFKGKSDVSARIAQLTSKLEAGATSNLPVARPN